MHGLDSCLNPGIGLTQISVLLEGFEFKSLNTSFDIKTEVLKAVIPVSELTCIEAFRISLLISRLVLRLLKLVIETGILNDLI